MTGEPAPSSPYAAGLPRAWFRGQAEIRSRFSCCGVGPESALNESVRRLRPSATVEGEIGEILMSRNNLGISLSAVLALLIGASSSWATLVPRMSFEEVVARSQSIVHGTVVRTWSDWDEDRTAIWTHYEIKVSASLKGEDGDTVVVSEPGGSVDGKHMQIAGTPKYEMGEEVMLFAAPTPIGYLRTCGWGQGKFKVSASGDAPSGKAVRSSLAGVQLVEGRSRKGIARAQTPLLSFQGMDLDQFKERVRRTVAAQGIR